VTCYQDNRSALEAAAIGVEIGADGRIMIRASSWRGVHFFAVGNEKLGAALLAPLAAHLFWIQHAIEQPHMPNLYAAAAPEPHIAALLLAAHPIAKVAEALSHACFPADSHWRMMRNHKAPVRWTKADVECALEFMAISYPTARIHDELRRVCGVDGELPTPGVIALLGPHP